ncbi:MAG TPA: 16S rRNA (uracil(1498)-N(3))-methyltransferase [bacterium]|nr:16S rRNA (uracil(1498)-N(3))-methyltransferase [bacterium]
MMIRLFLPPDQLSSKQIVITGEQARHLALVLRVTPGESLDIFDGLGFKYSCRIIECHKKEVIVERIKKERYSAESSISITLAQGIAKGDRMDLIIQKSTELGVNKIIPLITERAQVRHTNKLDRWKKIALSASQQSGRDKLPEIEGPVDIKSFFSRQFPFVEKGDKGGFFNPGIIFSEEKKERNLKGVLSAFKNAQQLTLLVGPEGGFSKEEITAAVENGFIEASLGPRILRTETAPITAISIIQYELGDVG